MIGAPQSDAVERARSVMQVRACGEREAFTRGDAGCALPRSSRRPGSGGASGCGGTARLDLGLRAAARSSACERLDHAGSARRSGDRAKHAAPRWTSRPSRRRRREMHEAGLACRAVAPTGPAITVMATARSTPAASSAQLPWRCGFMLTAQTFVSVLASTRWRAGMLE